MGWRKEMIHVRLVSRVNRPGDLTGGNVSRLTGSMRGRTLPMGGAAPRATTTSAPDGTDRADRGGHACSRAALDGN